MTALGGATGAVAVGCGVGRTGPGCRAIWPALQLPACTVALLLTVLDHTVAEQCKPHKQVGSFST